MKAGTSKIVAFLASVATFVGLGIAIYALE